MVRFQIRAKRLFLTYPQCTLGKELLLENVKAHFGENLDMAVVGHELHQDGNSHLHVAIWLKSVVSLSGAACLDHLASSHGDYRAMRNQKKCLEYVTKDGDIAMTEGMDVVSLLEAWSKKKSQVAHEVAIAVREGATMTEVEKSYSSFYMMNKRKIEEYHSWIQRKKAKPEMVWRGIVIRTPMSMEDSMIGAWLNSAIKQERGLRAKQLYIWGAPGLGKTHLIEELAKYLRIYTIPREDWETGYEDGYYDLAILDEFKGQKSLQWLNTWLDGSMMRLKIKGVDGGMKRQRIPTIILSNRDPRAVYMKVDTVYVDAFVDRLTVVNVVSRIDVMSYAMSEAQQEEAINEEF